MTAAFPGNRAGPESTYGSTESTHGSTAATRGSTAATRGYCPNYGWRVLTHPHANAHVLGSHAHDRTHDSQGLAPTARASGRSGTGPVGRRARQRQGRAPVPSSPARRAHEASNRAQGRAEGDREGMRQEWEAERWAGHQGGQGGKGAARERSCRGISGRWHLPALRKDVGAGARYPAPVFSHQNSQRLSLRGVYFRRRMGDGEGAAVGDEEAGASPEVAPEPEWPAHFPLDCPPGDAVPLNGVVYRFVGGAAVTPDDMKSHTERGIAEGADPSDRAGLSVFLDLVHARFLLATPRWSASRIASADLSPEHGQIKQTGKAKVKKHHTMWLRRHVVVTAHELFSVLP
jgi:hypothetical protein